ncbi:MAG: type I secretion C-terminal target domain-containing protein, partial [Pseudomonadota bacterium]|nr:type I secretion C-terminal target domain-containing protein [Pseudomonadota bacterium]
TTGVDGILVFDLDGSGSIEDGSEMFTPWFAGGNYASGVEALASLDSNGDAVLGTEDANFYKLQVWIDANADGINDAGELVSLTDLGIASINLHTLLGSGEVDGQTILSQGAFTYIDGGTGMFAEVGFDAALSSAPTPIVGGQGDQTLLGGALGDVFEWRLNDGGAAGAPATDTIINFDTASRSAGGDVLDLRDLLVGETSGNGADGDILANFLHFEKSGDDTIVHISTTGGFASDPHAVGSPSSTVLGAADQTIVLAGVDMIGAYTTDQQVIQDLLTRGKLSTD